MDNERSSFHPTGYPFHLAAAIVRLLPHPPNFAPIGGLALFGGARLNGWQAQCFAGAFFLIEHDEPCQDMWSCVSCQHTVFPHYEANFFVWLGSGVFYSHNLTGLSACYVTALPFFGRTILADLFYSGALFSAHYALSGKLSATGQIA